MAAQVIPVPVSEIGQALLARKFTCKFEDGEFVYYREGAVNPLLRLVVHVPATPEATEARARGREPVRVYVRGKVPGGEWVLRNCGHVAVTGTPRAVVLRLIDRLRDAAIQALKYGGPCVHCDSPTYADTGRCIQQSCRIKAA